MPPEMNNNEPAKQTDRRSKARNTAPDPMPQKDRPAKRGRSTIKKDGGSATGSSEPPKKDRKQRGMSAPEEVNQQGRRRSARIAQSEPMASAEPVPVTLFSGQKIFLVLPHTHNRSILFLYHACFLILAGEKSTSRNVQRAAKQEAHVNVREPATNKIRHTQASKPTTSSRLPQGKNHQRTPGNECTQGG